MPLGAKQAAGHLSTFALERPSGRILEPRVIEDAPLRHLGRPQGGEKAPRPHSLA